MNGFDVALVVWIGIGAWIGAKMGAAYALGSVGAGFLGGFLLSRYPSPSTLVSVLFFCAACVAAALLAGLVRKFFVRPLDALIGATLGALGALLLVGFLMEETTFFEKAFVLRHSDNSQLHSMVRGAARRLFRGAEERREKIQKRVREFPLRSL